jgi:hypothetical protein
MGPAFAAWSRGYKRPCERWSTAVPTGWVWQNKGVPPIEDPTDAIVRVTRAAICQDSAENLKSEAEPSSAQVRSRSMVWSLAYDQAVVSIASWMTGARPADDRVGSKLACRLDSSGLQHLAVGTPRHVAAR